ncbi:GAF domain-containing protein [Rhodobacteraceae bacterium]|nr:GAF domain-containing protein [Paracoccaceae bacterium]
MSEEDMHQQPNQDVDLTNCDREPIHLLGGVQPYGCLIATSSDFMINHVSENVQDILGLDPTEVIGGRLLDVLPEQTIHDLRTKLQLLNIATNSSRLFGYDVLGNGTRFDVSIHAQSQKYIFEFEPKLDTQHRDDMSLVQPLLARVKRADDVGAACDQAAMAIQALSNFDRVMVYKFHDDGSGEVIAERKQQDQEPFLGLRYPGSDIPKQARELYLRSVLRLISDVDGDVSPITPKTSIDGKPLDLSLAVTRAVSPIHLEYMRNMGVAASLSVSIIKDGALWGLFACHHNTPKLIDFERRTAIELFAQFFSYELARKMDIAARQEDENSRRLHDNLMVKLSGGTNLVNGFEVIAEELSSLIPNDGIAVFSDGQYAARGEAPSETEFHKLARVLNTAPAAQVFSTDRLVNIYPAVETSDADIAGLIAVPISRTPRDYIVFFRREIAKSVRWAGNPEKPFEVGPNGSRLTPRKSFEAWSEVVRNSCSKWSIGELNTAEALRVSLIEVVLKLTDEANEARQKFADKQELLIAELNHRVRNILNLIQGLVSQSRSEATDLASYTSVLDGRVQALARAHDQLTTTEWSPSSLRTLINVEFSAYMAGQHERLVITGDAPMLAPEAFSTIALVVHELVTNSAKYGAFTDHSGHVAIDLKIGPDGSLAIKWREIGGPPVKAPTRQGFGTTIIEKTIPYELKGKVETRYLLSGFEADIMIPSTSIAAEQETVTQAPVTVPQQPISSTVTLAGDVLVVEDNMIIAMDASDILSANGASKVHMAGSVGVGLSIIDANDISFALLDVNLGDQTSLPVANELAKQGIPFVLATGYGDAESITAQFPSALVISKPFTSEALQSAIRKTLE